MLISRNIGKWSKCEEFTDVTYGNLLQNGFGTVVFDWFVDPAVYGATRAYYWLDRQF